ncbi:glycerate kinase [Streptomyces sp. NBC_01537]|uniref:glycerate kinase n=1 Tax=Streptomyces sp. NBC_01537 TaxID=2903896 RepID=UPI00386D1B2F
MRVTTDLELELSRGARLLAVLAVTGGADAMVLALGGVATTDGGAGLLQSLGAMLAREGGTPIGPGGAGLAALRTVHLAEAHAAFAGVDLVLAADVDNPPLGPAGTAAVYGPQKGASANDVRELDGALAGFVRRLAASGAEAPPVLGAEPLRGGRGIPCAGVLSPWLDWADAAVAVEAV